MRFALVLTLAFASFPAAAQINFDQLSPATSPSARRSARAAAQPLADRERIWIFGGFGGNFLAETWGFDTASESWTQVTTSTSPSARDQHMLEFDAATQKAVLFGGFNLKGLGFTHLNDLWAFDPTASTWTQLTESTTKPSARGFSAFTYVPTQDAFYLFGGWDFTPSIFPNGQSTGGFFNDVWKLTISGNTGTWTQVTTTGTAPTARAATCYAYDTARHVIVMFGGQTGFDASGASVSSAETWELNVDTLAWTKVNATTPPSARAFCGTAFNSDRNLVMLYGGQLSGDTLTDGPFIYDSTTSTWTSEPLVDLNRGTIDDPSTAFSPTLGKVVMFGGRVVGGASSVYSNQTWTEHLEDHPPVANAGPDQSVNEQSAVTLNASASSDADNTPLAFTWTQTAGPTVTLTNANAAVATFTAPSATSPTTLTFAVKVSDGFYNATDSVNVVVNPAVNHPPVANAGPDQVAVEGSIVTLDGSASSDPDGNALSFQWTQIAGPTVALDNPASIAPRFTAPAAGAVLTFMLSVDDGSLASTDTVSITTTNAANQAPTANAGPNQDVAPGVVVTLDGRASSDPNGTQLTFAWTQTAGPAVVLDDPTSSTPRFDAPVELTDTPLTFALVVSDGVFVSAASSTTVTVREALGAPRFATIARTSAIVGQAYAYNDDNTAQATGSGVTYTLMEGPPGMTIDPVSGLVQWLPDVDGAVPVQIAATNSQGQDVQIFIIDVYAPPVITSTPSAQLLISQPYHYDDDDTPTATGTGDIRWSLLEGPSGMVVDVATGKITWVPVLDTTATVQLQAANAFGVDVQTFTVARAPDTEPKIVHTANPYAALGRPYLYDADSQVDVANLLPGDVVNVIPAPPVVPGFLMAENGRYVLWTPQATGTTTVNLDLVSSLGLGLDLYSFDVNVVDLGTDLAVAVAHATPTSGPAPLTVSFDGSESKGSKGAPLALYFWETGDGSHVGKTAPLGQAADPTAQYTYQYPGSYTAVLEAWDPYGVYARDKVTISVLDGGKQPPTARIHADVLTGRDQLTVHFSCDCSDPDGKLAGVEWSYGDGSFASDASPTHTYVQPGNYHVRVTAIDNDGLTGTDDVDVEVRSGDLAPPFAHIAATPAEGDQPMNVTLTADVGGGDGVVETVKWKLPDGTQKIGSQVSAVFPTPGYFPVLLEATDSNNLTGRDVLTIAVRAAGVRAPKIVSTPSLVALAGQPYAYDDDGKASAQGGRPIGWRLGKDLGGKKIGAPAGMSVDFDTGAITWKPTNAQAGVQHVVLVAENGAGADLQEFDVRVEASAAAAGCNCASTETNPSSVLFAALAIGLGLLRRRAARLATFAPLGSRTVDASRGAFDAPERKINVEDVCSAEHGTASSTDRSSARKRRSSSRLSAPSSRRAVAVVVVAVSATSALIATSADAAPTITSTPTTTATVGQVWSYETPEATGDGTLAWALGNAPAGMVVDNIDGKLLWMPTAAGSFDVDLVAADRTGTTTQTFTLDVAAGAPAKFDFTDPPGGYTFSIDEIGTLIPGEYLVRATGDQPMQFTANEGSTTCLWLAPNGTHIIHQAYAGTCTVTISVTNPWGSDTRVLDFTFVEPDAAHQLVVPSLTATPTEGAAPFLVTFDGTKSTIPPDDGTYAVASFIWFGDGDAAQLGVTADSLTIDHQYLLPGTYEATLQIVLRDQTLERASFSSTATVAIVVDAEESRPPSTSLTVDNAAGIAPLTTHFTSHTVEGDAAIADYNIDFGDGDHFDTQSSDFGGFVEPTTSHTYAQAGQYTATLTVTDTQGRQASSSLDVVATGVNGSPPIVHILAFPSRGEVPLTVSLDADESDLDGYIVRSTWILPDGQATAQAQPTFTLTEPGQATVQLVVADDSGLTTTARAIVTATKNGAIPPVVVSTPNTHAIAGQPWQYDADGIISVTGGGPYSFTLGKKLGGKIVNAPAGMALDNRTGKLTWAVPASVVGEVPVSVVVENAAGSTLHEFVLTVTSSQPLRGAPSGCASTSANAPPFAAFALALAMIGRVRRRRDVE